MKRRDVVIAAFQGDYGKPRPAVVIQSDLFGDVESVTLLPITSDLRPLPLLRVDIGPDRGTGLRSASQIMIDKAATLSRTKVGHVVGSIDDATMFSVNRALAIFLGFG